MSFARAACVQRQLPLVSVGFGLAQLLMGLGAVARGFDVRSPTQDQAVEMLDHLVDVGVSRQLHRKPSSERNGAWIVREVQVEPDAEHRLGHELAQGLGRPASPGDSDQRFGHGLIVRSNGPKAPPNRLVTNYYTPF